jgi:putative peptidoglycan lipid II flippase
MLMGPLAQVGLAVGTAIGAWVNVGLMVWLAARAGIITMDARLKRSLIMLAVSGCLLGVVVFLTSKAVPLLFRNLPAFRDEAALVTLAVIAAAVYAVLILLLLGRNWFRGFSADRAVSGTVEKSG